MMRPHSRLFGLEMFTSSAAITNAGLRESHVHDVIITKEAPNYSVGPEGPFKEF